VISSTPFPVWKSFPHNGGRKARAFFLLPLILLFFFSAVPVSFSADFGLLLDQELEANIDQGSESKGENFNYMGLIFPWFSAKLGDSAHLYLSAGFTARYENEKYSYTPELFRTEFSCQLGKIGEIAVGRLQYADPLGVIASGLFDGLRFELDIGDGIFSLAAFYTGLLNRRTANIALTADESESLGEPLDWEDFTGTYFAPRRLLFAAGYDSAAPIRLRFALLGQVDIKGGDQYYHTQYAVARLTLPFYKNIFTMDAGGIAELIETTGSDPAPSFAANCTFAFMPPGGIQDRIYLGGRWASGTLGNTVSAFTPITLKNQGHILKAKFSGLASIEAGYTARLHRSFSLQLEGMYFFRTDQITYTGFPVWNSSSYLVGGEGYAQLIWSPLSDLKFNLGGGVFIPQPETEEKNRWQISFNMTLAIL
jgi:hypothetical protein